MQRTFRPRRSFSSPIGTRGLALAVLLGIAVAIGGLVATDTAPWLSDDTPSVGASRTAQMEPLQRFYDHKEARQEAAELQASEFAARAAHQDALRRYYEHKEQQLDALP